MSAASTTASSKIELCMLCETEPGDLTCSCGGRFDFNCAQQHAEYIGYELQENQQQVAEKLTVLNNLKSTHNPNYDAARAVIENWKQRRTRDVDDIAEQVLNDLRQQENTSADVASIKDTYAQLSANSHRVDHTNLNAFVELHRQIQNRIQQFGTQSTLFKDGTQLDASLQSRLNPQASNADPPSSTLTNGHHSIPNSNDELSPVTPNHRDLTANSNDQRPTASMLLRELLTDSDEQNSTPRTSNRDPTAYINHRDSTAASNYQHPPARMLSRDLLTNSNGLHSTASANDQLRTSSRTSRDLSATNGEEQPAANTANLNSTRVETERPMSGRNAPEVPEVKIPSSVEPIVELTNLPNSNHISADTTDQDEFEAGKTRFIQRSNPKIIRVSNDKNAGTVCCHENQVLYNRFDPITQDASLVFISDISNSLTTINVEWESGDELIHAVDDDESIQDIVYSDKLANYLVLSRARLRRFSDSTKTLSEFHAFNDHVMKRLSCSEKYIYLAATPRNAVATGDEIILLNYDKTEVARKTFREIIPARINRAANLLVGEISDVAVGSNEQIALGYRLERRNEVGVFVFNVQNDGKEWAYVKQLLLNDCWHRDLQYTPRIDWSQQLNVFILIEHMTGHLIMIDKEGQVEGECRFMHAENRRESPLNLSISTNGWFCVRYESSINIHKLTL